MSLTGTKLALEESLPGSYLFVFTDAGAHDQHLVETVMSLCQEKQSQIVFVLTGNICPTTSVYARIATASNGQVFEIRKEEIGQVIEYVKETIKGDRSVITNKVVPRWQLTNVPFTIDDKTEYALVSASGQHVTLKVMDNYSRVITGSTQITWTENVKVLKLTNLRPGSYVAQVFGTTNVNVMIFARTDFTFEYGFANRLENSLTETQPTIGTLTHLIISVKDEEHSVTIQAVQILDMNENVLATHPLTNLRGNVYATQQFVPPNHTFKVAVTATGRSTGQPLRRIAKTPVKPIRPVTVSPEIIDSTPYLKKIEGSTVDLPCRIRKGKPKPSITWYFMKKGTRDFVQMRDKTEVLHLTNVLMDNDGHYRCVANNIVGSAEHIVQLEVEVAPRIADSETFLQKREGSTVDIGCRIQKGNPTPNIRWFFMKKGTRDYVQMRGTTNEVLRLTNVLVDNEGHYKCEAENTVGRAEHVVQLEVEVAPKIADSEPYLKKREGSTVDISCRIQKGNPRPNIRWFFMKKGTRDYVQMRGTANEVLRLTNVLVDNEGHYKCEAENTVGRAEHIVQLEVEVPPRITFPTPYRGVEGDVVMKLSCIAEGHPKPTISWTINNYTVSTDKSKQSYVEDGSLFVKNPVSENSNNTYVCVATNGAGEQRQTYEVLISELADYNQPEKKYGEIGKPFGINCSLPFTDPNSVRWFKNSKYLNVTGASIRWENASQANDGNYTCRVSDLSGAASVTVELTFGLPPAPSFGETVFEMEWHDALQVDCVADLNMNGTYEWYRNGERIKDANERELNVHQFGWGNYTCRAVNPLGSLNITYNIPTQSCVIDKNLWTTKKMPVIIDNTPAWPTFSHNQKFVVVPHSEKLNLICQDEPPRGELVQPQSLNNSFTKFPSLRAIVATCDHKDTFLVDGVSQKISELDCTLSVTPSVVPSGKQCLGDNTQMIDVGFYVDDLIKVYSSCLDTNRNLSLYTTVTMKGPDIPREAREPKRPCKQVGNCCYETIELVSAEDIGFGAAEWETLKEPRNSVFYCRLSKNTFTNQVTTIRTESWSRAAESSPGSSVDTTENPSVQSSTTEAPPNPETNWHDIERKVRNSLKTVTVWTGAGNYTRVGDMMVPRYLWKVVKNLDDDKIVAIVHSNAQAPIPKLCADDCRSSPVLALFEPQGDRTYCCSLNEFKTAFNLPLAF